MSTHLALGNLCTFLGSVMQGGDDLEDDFVPDDLVALSDAESVVGSSHSVSDGGDDAISGGEETGAQSTANTTSDKKRKRREKDKERRAKVSKRPSFISPYVMHP